jgi:hypothetical protein
MERYYELEDLRRTLIMLPPQSPGLDREEAVRLLAELQDALRSLAAIRAAQAP